MPASLYPEIPLGGGYKFVSSPQQSVFAPQGNSKPNPFASAAPTVSTPLPSLPISPEAALVKAGNEFAFKVIQDIQQKLTPETNIFISPLSISIALMLAANGAKGDTLLGKFECIALMIFNFLM